MDTTLKMATFPRHGHLVMGFFPSILELFKRNEIYPLQEEHILAFRGKKFSGDETLIDVTTIDNKNYYSEHVIDLLDFVQPDFLFFKENSYLQNLNGLRTIGVPDLVVEVWSANNDEYEKSFKRRLYSSSPMCEHWYLSQTDNLIECYLGSQKLQNQHLSIPLVTQKGIVFDLTYLAL